MYQDDFSKTGSTLIFLRLSASNDEILNVSESTWTCYCFQSGTDLNFTKLHKIQFTYLNSLTCAMCFVGRNTSSLDKYSTRVSEIATSTTPEAILKKLTVQIGKDYGYACFPRFLGYFLCALEKLSSFDSIIVLVGLNFWAISFEERFLSCPACTRTVLDEVFLVEV